MRDRSEEELRTMLATLRQELFTARFKNHTNRLYDSSEMPKKRRDIARVMTILRERELGRVPGGPKGDAAEPAEE